MVENRDAKANGENRSLVEREEKVKVDESKFCEAIPSQSRRGSAQGRSAMGSFKHLFVAAVLILACM